MLNADYNRYIRQLKSKEYLPKVIIHFFEKMHEMPKPVIRKKLSYEYDTLQHKAGKPILERKILYPYANFNKAEEHLKNILNMEFPKNLDSEEFVKDFKALKATIEQDKNFTKTILAAFMNEDEPFYQAQAEISTNYAFMCYFIAYFALLPFIIHMVSQIKQIYDEEPWHHGHCPNCGTPPLMSYLKGKEGKRINACSLCLSLYRVPRIQCPYCLESKQDRFNIFTSDSDAEFQVCVCKKCKNYIKIHDYKEYEKFSPHPLLDDFKSITLDLISEKQNYTKAVLSLWLI